MKEVRFTPKAVADLAEARDWYESQREGLGADMLAEVARIVERIRALPTQYRVVDPPDTRRALVRRFPYAMFFIDGADEVVVLAVLHQAMNASR